MFKYAKSQRGYALLIVLFLVVLIMSLSALFFRSSLNNATQEVEVDENHLTVVAAEMGVDYYTTLYINEFLKQQYIQDQKISKLIRDNTGSNKTPDYKKYRTDSINSIETALKTAIKKDASIGGGNIQVIGYSFKSTYENIIAELPAKSSFGEIVVEGRVNGELKGRPNKSDKQKELSYRLTFFVPSYDPKDFIAGENNGESATAINYNVIFPSPVTKECLSISEIKEKETECTYSVGFNLPNSDLEIKKKSNIVVNGNIILDDMKLDKDVFLLIKGDMNADEVDVKQSSHIKVVGKLSVDELDIKENSTVYVEKDFIATDEVDINKGFLYVKLNANINDELDIKSGKMYVGGNLEVKDEISLEKSLLYVGMNLTVNDELEIEKSSSLFVKGSMFVKDELEVDKTSKVCVGGDLTVKKLSGKGKVFMIKNKKFSGSGSNNITWVNDYSELLVKCNQNDTTGQMADWDLIDVTVDY